MTKYVPIPSQPHPDVAIVKAALLHDCQPGTVCPAATIAAAIQLKPTDPIFYRRQKKARDQLRREGVNIVSVRGEGFLRETPDQTMGRHQGRERKSMNRKARRNGESLAAVDVASFAEEKRAEYFAERTINNVVIVATGHQARQKMLAAAKATSAVLPMAKALLVLTNGSESKG